jgi:hypothetical protein
VAFDLPLASGRAYALAGEHVRRASTEYTEHYHRERNHQGLGNELIDPRSEDFRGDDAAECRERLGGMLRYYGRAA